MGAHVQDLAEVVQDLHPALYLNNRNNEQTYQQTLINSNRVGCLLVTLRSSC